ncbi:hypothetical protein [Aeromicrobium sp.]|uniref:hypothetical protein n=1 Tax=Aeromicrobium sp. TaxID=1871063 RepID=UPI0030C0F5E1
MKAEPARVGARTFGVILASAVLLGGCQDSQGDPTPSPTPTEADGAYCGLVSTKLIDSIVGSDVEVNGDLVTTVPSSGVVECRISSTTGPANVMVVADPDTGSPSPKTVDTDGCTPVDVPGWGPVSACLRDNFVNLVAYPPKDRRFFSINVRLNEPKTRLKASDAELKQATDAAVRVAQDVNTNLDRF